jgi:hypothetical protein
MKHGRQFLEAWAELLTLATKAQRKILEAILARATKPLADLAELVDLASGKEELGLLTQLLTPVDGDAYERQKARSNQYQRAASRKVRDIGPLPAVVAPQRRKRCEKSLLKFCETYLKESIFPLDFGPNHKTLMSLCQKRVLEGGLQAAAMPRGEGKTAILEAALMWAVLYGHHRYAIIVHATQELAEKGIDRIRAEIETNDLLLEDFPEVCYPIRQLDGLGQKTSGQILDGERTKIEWGKAELVLPTVHGSVSSGSRIEAHGITGAIRGLVAMIDGQRRRPSLTLIDDFQTDESSRSTQQCADRLDTITRSILGLVGPGEEMTAMAAITVMVKGDAADSLLSRDIYPEWNGLRLGFMRGEPSEPELWEQYNTLRLLAAMDKKEPVEAWDYYRQHQERMDAGFDVSWAGKVPKRYLSPKHYAGEIRLSRPAFFWSEMQNDPQDIITQERFLRADDIAIKTLNYDRGVVPLDAQWIVVSIDVQLRVLYYMVQAISSNFTSYIIEYGCYPEQKRPIWTAATARPTLAEVYRGQTEDAQIYMGLRDLVDHLCKKRWTRVDGVEQSLNLVGIDANWKGSVVKQFCRESQFGGVCFPVHSNFIGCNETPISEYRARAGERIGEEWIISKNKNSPVRFLRIDSNYWATQTARRLATAHPNPGAMSLYGPIGTRHDFLARHLDSELRKTETGRRTVDVWTMRPGETENHWGDTAKVGQALGSVCGAKSIASASAVRLPPSVS